MYIERETCLHICRKLDHVFLIITEKIEMMSQGTAQVK